VTDNGGKTVETTKQITVDNPAPTAELTYSPSTPNPDDTVTLDASGSSDSDGTIVSYEWDGDGDGDYSDDYYTSDDPSDGQTATISFDSGGTTTVGLRVTDNGGKTVKTTKRITVENPAPKPKIESTATDGLTVRLSGSGSSDPDGRITQFSWYQSGDRIGEGQHIDATFRKKGEYQIELRVTDNGGRTESTRKTISVSQKPEGGIRTSLDPVPVGENIELIADVEDPDGTIRNHTWVLPSGLTAQGDRTTAGFGTTGSKTVKLILTDDTGNTETLTRQLVVREPPEVRIEASQLTAIDGEVIDFTVQSPDRIQSYEWDIDNDGRYEASGESASSVWESGGERTVTVKAVGSNDVPTTASVTVDIREVKPAVELSISPEIPRPGQDAVFNATPVSYSVGKKLSTDWEFEAGGSKTGQTVTHTFESAGKFVVRARIEDESGDQTTVERIVTVQRSVSFDLTTEQTRVLPGDNVDIVFSGSNRLRSQSVSAKLDLRIPQGVSVTGVSGGSLVSRSETDFVRIKAGGSNSLTVNLQINEAGEYNITGDAVYYLGNESDDDRRSVKAGSVRLESTQTQTETADRSSQAETSGGGTPLGPSVVGMTAALGVLVLLYYVYRRNLS
jgi:plastocyanin